ncbi:hypothetical protein RQP46_010543 [Phenoliferia psychrophenolica]
MLVTVAASLALTVSCLAASLPSAEVVLRLPARMHPSRATQFPDYIARNLGPYSPYAAAGAYPALPNNCTIVQANILQRHGARFPTSGAGARILASVKKLQTATSFGSSLSFVPEYTYDLGSDDLNALGAEESSAAGHLAASRYASLAMDPCVVPFVRTDSSQRVVDSAGNWTAGFITNTSVVAPSAALILDGTTGSNDTLENNNCPNSASSSAIETKWLNHFAPNITARINADAPGANVSNADTLNFMQLCGFDTEYAQDLSPWCGIFQPAEWSAFEYYYDLDKWAGNGYGNALGPSQGVGYVNELLSRVTGDISHAKNDQTQVNHTLDSSDATFPLGRTLYADFSHDNQITSILAAMGLKKNGSALTASGPPQNQTWVTSQIVPFAGHLVTEVLQCGEQAFVRFLINDQLQPAEFCGDGSGLCLVDDFVASQSYATNNGNGDYLKCGYVPE